MFIAALLPAEVSCFHPFRPLDKHQSLNNFGTRDPYKHHDCSKVRHKSHQFRHNHRFWFAN